MTAVNKTAVRVARALHPHRFRLTLPMRVRGVFHDAVPFEAFFPSPDSGVERHIRFAVRPNGDVWYYSIGSWSNARRHDIMAFAYGLEDKLDWAG